MEQPRNEARYDYDVIDWDIPTRVHIPGTKRFIKLTGIHPYTLRFLTKLWMKRDISLPKDSSDTVKDMCIEPYFAIKEACIFTLNCWWKLHLVYPIKWRIWAFIHEYTEEQMMPVIQEGKKKLPLTAHWTNMAFSTDMRTDWMKMTSKEAEQYRAELLLAASQLSSKSSPAMGDSVSA